MQDKDLEIRQIKKSGCLGCGHMDYGAKAMFEGSCEKDYYVVLFLECANCGRVNKVLFSDAKSLLQKWQEIFASADQILKAPKASSAEEV